MQLEKSSVIGSCNRVIFHVDLPTPVATVLDFCTTHPPWMDLKRSSGLFSPFAHRRQSHTWGYHLGYSQAVVLDREA